MEINATVDVGENVTGMLEKLAGAIGTTADKVYPWYVQQAYLEGVTVLVGVGALLVISIVVFCVAAPRADFDKKFISSALALISAVGLLFGTIGMCLEGASASRKIINPNYYAVKMMTQDIGRLVGK